MEIMADSLFSVSDSTFLVERLFPEDGDQLGVHPGEGGGEATGEVEFADRGFDPGWVSEGAEEIIGGQAGEPFSVHGIAFAQHVLAGKQGEHGIADPCFFSFLAEFFVFSAHAGNMSIKGTVAQVFACVLAQCDHAGATRNSHPNIRAGVRRRPNCKAGRFECG